MDSAASLRSFQYSWGTHVTTQFRKPVMVAVNDSVVCNLSKLPVFGGKLISSTNRSKALLLSCQKTSGTTVVTATSNSDPNGSVVSDNQQNAALEKKSQFNAPFPDGFEALLTEVCDETKIAELKVKFGAFEIHMKRNIDSPPAPAPAPAPVFSQTASPVPSEPTKESVSAGPPLSPKSSVEKVGPFTNVSVEKATKLAALEASGVTGYVIVSSSTVGSFRRAKTLKGKKQAPACKEGNVIKEGQVIGFIDQFGTELPITSDVAGEVLKFLYDDGEAVGYGDPLVAVRRIQ